jgi:hypothetical protein
MEAAWNKKYLDLTGFHPWRVDYRKRGQNSKIPSLVRVPVKIPLARKLGTIEEQGQDQSCVFRQSNYMKKGHNIEKVSWVLPSVKVLSLTGQLSLIQAAVQRRDTCRPEADTRGASRCLQTDNERHNANITLLI